MAETTLNVETKFQLETLALVRPGDTLVVAVNRRLTMEDANAYTDALRERLPGVEIVVVDACQLAVYRPGDAS
jgi:hypothetical protein